MDHNAFANTGQLVQVIFGGISALVAIVSFTLNFLPHYRFWIGGIATLVALALAYFGFATWLPHWSYWVMGAVAIGVAYVAGRFGEPRPMSVTTAAATPLPDPANAESFTPIKVLSVKLHVSKDVDVKYKKKLVIILRNLGHHDIHVGPKASWVPGELRVQHTQQLVWENEPDERWEKEHAWKWQSAESDNI